MSLLLLIIIAIVIGCVVDVAHRLTRRKTSETLAQYEEAVIKEGNSQVTEFKSEVKTEKPEAML